VTQKDYEKNMTEFSSRATSTACVLLRSI